MANTLQLSPAHLDDAIKFCDVCGEETNHISLFTRFTDSGETGYALECEGCTLTWEWA